MTPFHLRLCACLALGMAALAAHAEEPPRTAAGRPDLQGMWLASFLTPLERPDGLDALEPSTEDATQLSRTLYADLTSSPVEDPDVTHTSSTRLAEVRGASRSSLIIDPQNGRPPYSSAGLARQAAAEALAKTGYDHPEQRDGWERCLTGFFAAPMRPSPLIIPIQIVQTTDALVIAFEDVGAPRIIPISQSPPRVHGPEIDGRSVGRWEGDALIVETAMIRGDVLARGQFGAPIPVGPKTRITERFEFASDDELVYRATLSDAELYTSDWTLEYSYRRSPTQVLEYACHEANYSMINILQAGRMRDLHAGAR